jgi:hypothetical protein
MPGYWAPRLEALVDVPASAKPPRSDWSRRAVHEVVGELLVLAQPDFVEAT